MRRSTAGGSRTSWARSKCAGDPLDKKWLVVCFMHNVYGVGDTSSGLTGMPRLVSAIYSKHGIVANVPCIVGGDFNTPPRPTGTGRTVRFVEAAELDPTNKNTPYNTTDSHPYDWWSYGVNIATFALGRKEAKQGARSRFSGASGWPKCFEFHPGYPLRAFRPSPKPSCCA